MQKIVRVTAFDYVVFRIGKENCDTLKKRGVLKEVYGKITDDTIPCIRFFNSGKQIRYYNAYEEKFESFTDKEFDLIMRRLKKEEKNAEECIVVKRYLAEQSGYEGVMLNENLGISIDRQDILRVVNKIYSILKSHDRYIDFYEPADEEYEYITQNSCNKENYDINILYLDYSQR